MAVAMAMVSPGIGTPMLTPTWAMIWALASWAVAQVPLSAGACAGLGVHMGVGGLGCCGDGSGDGGDRADGEQGRGYAATMAGLTGTVSPHRRLCYGVKVTGSAVRRVLAVVGLPGQFVLGNGEGESGSRWIAVHRAVRTSMRASGAPRQ